MELSKTLNINDLNLDSLVISLSAEQKEYLLKKLKKAIFGAIPNEVNVCPCCGETDFIKHGSYKDKQKFKCKKTSKIFSYKSNSVLSGIWNLDKLSELLELIVNGKYPTITEIQEKLSITRKTAHAWRTKILTALYEEVDLDNQVIEFDETFFRLSWKGRKDMQYSRTSGKKLVGDNKYNVKVFMSFSRSTGRLELFQSHMGKSTAQDVENYLGVKKSIVVYSDKHKSYKKYYKKRRILHRTFKAKNHVSKWNKAVHNQTLNYYSGALGNFLNDNLQGVSTKYLQCYLNWFMFIEYGKREARSIQKAVIDNKMALDIFKQKEKEFLYFLKINGRNIYGSFKDKYYGKTA